MTNWKKKNIYSENNLVFELFVRHKCTFSTIALYSTLSTAIIILALFFLFNHLEFIIPLLALTLLYSKSDIATINSRLCFYFYSSILVCVFCVV